MKYGSFAFMKHEICSCVSRRNSKHEIFLAVASFSAEIFLVLLICSRLWNGEKKGPFYGWRRAHFGRRHSGKVGPWRWRFDWCRSGTDRRIRVFLLIKRKTKDKKNEKNGYKVWKIFILWDETKQKKPWCKRLLNHVYKNRFYFRTILLAHTKMFLYSRELVSKGRFPRSWSGSR